MAGNFSAGRLFRRSRDSVSDHRARIGGFLRFYQKFRRHLHTVEVFSGVLLLAVGGLVFLNRLTWLSGKLAFLE